MPDGKTSTKFRRSKEENRLSLNKTYLNVFEVLIWVTKKWLFSEKVTNFDYCMPGDVLANLWRAMTCENVHWFRCRLHWIRRLRARAMHGHLVVTNDQKQNKHFVVPIPWMEWSRYEMVIALTNNHNPLVSFVNSRYEIRVKTTHRYFWSAEPIKYIAKWQCIPVSSGWYEDSMSLWSWRNFKDFKNDE